MQNPVYLESFKKLGANAIPLPFSELFSALEDEDGRRPGEPVQHDPVEQVLRGAEVPVGHQPRLPARGIVLVQQEVVGPAVEGRAEGC